MRNELGKFGYLQPTSVSDAVSLLSKYGGNARVIAGGTDLLYQMKDHLELLTPERVIDITQLGLSGIGYSQSGGLTIGATTNVGTLKNDPNVIQYYPALAQAATGHPTQIANLATVAGDINQEVWCWYLRNNYDCWRNGGTVCYAVVGDNRYYHSLFGGNLCYAVHAADLSAPLMALGATLTVQGPGGSKTMSMEQFLPGVSIVDGRVKENSLRFNEIVTSINVPTPASGTQQAYFRIADRTAIDFPLASAAVVVGFNGSTVSSAKIVLGHVATKPIRATSAESAIVGQQLTETVIANAAQKAFAGATPLTHGSLGANGTGQGNAFRTYIGQGAVMNALRSLPGAVPGVVAPTTS
ncbi:MAG: FAD binding domain-containing protein [Nitrososphaerales archaeon]|jgi:xanthine dehydrogenase YagS FAD-binding subunit